MAAFNGPLFGPLPHELVQLDFLGRLLQGTENSYCLGKFRYYANDAAEFLQLLQFLCQNQASAPGILRLLGAKRI
ncbi:hypothetical protein [Loigolactobacillus binensis]|uniref:Uncharacterized protein n=1 Tax=Loigolactobacillus binensis TaxID=2559922 RepID=A0ABW3EGM9_9LACO|nr:hypothetical protein [Loigolactobacillus binensis]